MIQTPPTADFYASMFKLNSTCIIDYKTKATTQAQRRIPMNIYSNGCNTFDIENGNCLCMWVMILLWFISKMIHDGHSVRIHSSSSHSIRHRLPWSWAAHEKNKNKTKYDMNWSIIWMNRCGPGIVIELMSADITWFVSSMYFFHILLHITRSWNGIKTPYQT